MDYKQWMVRLLCLLGFMVPALGWGQSTLASVQERGKLECGVSQGLPGFSNPDDKARWSGLDVDFCRALAAAVLKDSNKVNFVPLSAQERFTALQTGTVDVLSRNTTWTMHRDSELGLNFSAVMFYDGQGFMVSKELGVKSALQLNGATVCTNKGTTTELNAADYFLAQKMDYQIITYETIHEVSGAFEEGRCDVLTADRSQLAALRLLLKDPDAYFILPETISKEPLGPVVRQGDEDWLDIVRWTVFLLINAEEYGITSKNIETMKKSSDPNILRIIGETGSFGDGLGLDEQWGYRIIKSVGNYGEIFERNVGQESPLKIGRGINQLWTQGGIQYAPPIR